MIPIMKTTSNFRRYSARFGLVALAITSVVIGSGANSLDKVTEDPRDLTWKLHIDEQQVVGVDACQKCHASEINRWKQTPHFETFHTLHRKKEAQEIAQFALGCSAGLEIHQRSREIAQAAAPNLFGGQ